MLGGSCSPCCVSCPDYRIFMQASSIAIDFEWSRSTVQTLQSGVSVNVSTQRYIPRQTVLVHRYNYANFQGFDWLADYKSGLIDTHPLPAEQTSHRKELLFGMVYYRPAIYSGPYVTYRETAGGGVGLSLKTYYYSWESIGFSETPCHGSTSSEPCRRSIGYNLFDSFQTRRNKALINVVGTINGNQAFSYSWSHFDTSAMTSFSIGQYDGSLPESVTCGSSRAYIPEVPEGSTSLTVTSVEDPVEGFYGNDTQITETLIVYSAKALIDGGEYNILGASEGVPAWNVSSATYRNDSGTFPIPT